MQNSIIDLQNGGFVTFTTDSIYTELNVSGIEKKKLKTGLPKQWQIITNKTMNNFNNSSHKVVCVQTGIRSAVTVLDVDDKNIYNKLIMDFPELKTFKTIETNNGFHIYCSYDPEVLTSTDCFKTYPKIDVRNDKACVFASGTQYNLLSGETAEYNDIGGTILPIPELLKKDIKRRVTSVVIPDTTDADTDVEVKPKRKIKVKKELISKPTNIADADEIIVSKLIECFSVERATDRTTWLNVGFMIRNVIGASKTGLNSFLLFSKKCLTYNKDECSKKFSELLQVDNGFTIASGIKWAKEDNQILYIKLFPFQFSTDFSTKQAGAYFHLCYSKKFIFTNGVLYVWNGVYWTKDDKRFTLLVKEITEVWYCDLLKIAEGEKDEEKRKAFKKVIRVLLYSSNRKPFVDDILYELTDNNIQWNKNPTLFVFENCVYDLTSQRVIESNPLDYCNRSCGYQYRDVTAEEIAELNVLLISIFPNEGIRNHYLEILATGLSAIQTEKLFIATGGGGNGKSLINSLMLMTVGQYGYKMPSSILTKEIKQGANPEVANLDEVRFALCQEPDSKKPLVASVVKEITGDKTLNCRQLYSNECLIHLCLTLVLEANEVPKSDEVNQAMNRRIDITPFDSTAVSQEDFDLAEDKTNLCVADTRYKSDAFQEQYKIVLFHLLAKYFAIFVKNGLKMSDPPAEVKTKGKSYLANSDNLYDWFITYYMEDATSVVSMSDVFQKYSECQLQNTTRRIRTNADTKKKLTELFATNLFLGKFLKERGLYFCKQRLSTTAVCGWRIKTNAEIEE